MRIHQCLIMLTGAGPPPAVHTAPEIKTGNSRRLERNGRDADKTEQKLEKIDPNCKTKLNDSDYLVFSLVRF